MTNAISPDLLLEAARECAALAGAVAFSHYQTKVAVETKGDGSPVTIADRSAEERVREWIRIRFPGDGILGEEFGEHAGTSRRRWIVDPIDGTKAFVRGVPLWGSLVAVVEGEEVLAGAATFPALGESIAAASGCGSWHNGSRCRVSSESDIRAATALITDDRIFPDSRSTDRWRTLAGTVAICRSWGDAFGYLMVATGRAEIMVDAIVNAWDIACFLPIIREAGGAFTDLAGKTTAFGGNCVATNAALAAEARRIL
ncbi:MAG TPA: inositol monophosphatase family protein, partial [Casimicrobiaceae bacterium]